eukprot:CAMPEP_0177265502 /NCGR_PEP_ID=MMETSP0367-20130122/62155_1 /TAXON_ID=447022 ORGANISM="Scrippsiella hangoei-like, Strain SHHI-4" /NCGR_SAMPLE_ID=MMETSP0367 /ASSEMBLY_ACC=CAM_ASM_000362 /LENGTH=189 /DNA_ID=CAMNT_0018720749 /DNA_START=137 /DNA_END=708 /DNA_ORIENTATION=-
MADVEPPPKRTMLPDNNASPTRAKDHRAADMLADEEPNDSDCTSQALQEEIVPSRRMEQLGNPVGEKKFRGEPLRQGQRTASLVPPVVERGERHGKREYEQQVPHPAAHRQVNCREKESMRPDLKVAPRAPSLRQHLLGPFSKATTPPGGEERRRPTDAPYRLNIVVGATWLECPYPLPSTSAAALVPI